MQSMGDEFDRISKAMRNGQLGVEEIRQIHKSIVVEYGYKFAHFIFRLSNVSDFILSEEEQTIHARYTKAFHAGHHIAPDVSQVKEVSIISDAQPHTELNTLDSIMIHFTSNYFTTILGRANPVGTDRLGIGQQFEFFALTPTGDYWRQNIRKLGAPTVACYVGAML